MVYELQQSLVVRAEVGDGSRRDAGLHRSPGNGGRDVHDQPRIERFRNQIIGSELDVLGAIGGSNDVRLFRHREIRDRAHTSELHRFVDGRGTDVERTSKDERKAQHVVHLVRKVRAAGGDDRVWTGGLGHVGHDLRFRIGQRKYQRLVRHSLDHFRLENSARRKTQKDVGISDDVCELARLGALRIARFVLIHLFSAPAVHDASDVGNPDVFPTNAEAH